jgi:glycosyltransferase involved in cell wall biosynthesis
MSGYAKMSCDQRRCPDWDRCSEYTKSGHDDICGLLEEEHHMSKEKGFISGQVDVIIPAYNCEAYVVPALESIYRQSYPRNKITVTLIDDGSTDGTLNVIKEFDSMARHSTYGELANFTVITLPINRGANFARNSGLAVERGEFVYIMDADSMLAEEALDCFVKALTIPADNIGYAYSGFTRLWDSAERGGGLPVVDVFPSMRFDAEALKKNNYISMMSLIRRSVIPTDGFDVDITRFQDWDMWLTLLEFGIVGTLVEDILFTAHIRNDGISRDQGKIPVLKSIVLKKHGL